MILTVLYQIKRDSKFCRSTQKKIGKVSMKSKQFVTSLNYHNAGGKEHYYFAIATNRTLKSRLSLIEASGARGHHFPRDSSQRGVSSTEQATNSI